MQYYGYIQVNKKNLFGGMPLIPATNVVAILVEFCMQGKVQFSIELVRIFFPDLVALRDRRPARDFFCSAPANSLV
jgi:hypothetical protein